MTTTIRSRKVRRILRLEGQADRQATREARATARATLLAPPRGHAPHARRAPSRRALNGGQRGELARARASPARDEPALRPARPAVRRRAGDGPRCPVMHGEAADAGAAHRPELHEEV